MTTVDVPAVAPATDEELRSVLAQADPSLLVNCLIQLTGDVELLQLYQPYFAPTAVRSVLDSHTIDGAIIDDVIDRMIRELTKRTDQALPPPSTVEPALFRRMAEFCVGEPVSAEFVPILEEQAGFVKARRVVPITRTPPHDFNVIVIGAGMTGITPPSSWGRPGSHIMSSRVATSSVGRGRSQVPRGGGRYTKRGITRTASNRTPNGLTSTRWAMSITRT